MINSTLPIAARLPRQLGFWSALLAALTMVIFTYCFVALFVVNPLFTWTNLADYVTFTRTYPSPLPDLARLMVLIYAFCYVVQLNCLYEVVMPEQQFLVRIALCFGVAFAVLSGAHYFVQLSSVRVQLAAGTVAGLEQVVQANPYSALAAINMLGISVCFGLSSLFVAPVFGGGGVGRFLQIAFLVNGVACLVGAVGYVEQWLLLVFVAINLGMGGAMTAIPIALARWFRRQ